MNDDFYIYFITYSIYAIVFFIYDCSNNASFFFRIDECFCFLDFTEFEYDIFCMALKIESKIEVRNNVQKLQICSILVTSMNNVRKNIYMFKSKE